MRSDAKVKEILKYTLYTEEAGCISTPDCCNPDKSCGDDHVIHANGAEAKRKQGYVCARNYPIVRPISQLLIDLLRPAFVPSKPHIIDLFL